MGKFKWTFMWLKQGNQPRIFIGRSDAKAETPIFWPPGAKSWLIGKGPDVRKDWRWEEKGATEDEMVGWHHQLNGHGFGWTPGVSDGQGGLACCSSWGHQESDTTEWVNWTELKIKIFNVTYVLHSAWTRIEQLYSKISQSREVMWDFSSMTEL